MVKKMVMKTETSNILNKNAVYRFLDMNVSLVDLNGGPTEFGEVWSQVINKCSNFNNDKVMDYVLGYYYDKTKMRGL